MPSRKEIWLSESEMSVRITEDENGQTVQTWQDMKMVLKTIPKPTGFSSQGGDSDAVALGKP